MKHIIDTRKILLKLRGLIHAKLTLRVIKFVVSYIILWLSRSRKFVTYHFYHMLSYHPITKLLLNKSVALLFIVLPSMAFTQTEDKVKMLQAVIYLNHNNPMLVHIRYNNYTEKMTVVSIKDNRGRYVYLKWSACRQGNIKFNTEQMPNGTYTISVRSRKTTFVKHVDVHTLYSREIRRIAMLE